MIKIVFDWTRFGCNEQAVKDLVELLGYIPMTKEKGVRVKPGMRVKYKSSRHPKNNHEYVVAPNGTDKDQPFDGMSFWDSKGSTHWSGPIATPKYISFYGEPVIGYKLDVSDE